uniref:Neuralized E3 ubiquitin protein ligase 3 n=1 Tax=Pelusios castaneus TaxID=367368 RepID=A0A8C8RIV0_9SAUR
MGGSLSHLCDLEISDEDFPQPLLFHRFTHGTKVLLNESCSVAERIHTFHDGIVFTHRPVKCCERVMVKILKKEGSWHGGLRVGFTSMDPSRIEPGCLPPFVCPDLVLQGKTWAAVLPDECGEEGTILSFWVDHKGRLFFRSNQEEQNFLLLKGVARVAHLWAVIDVYGHTKAVQLLDLTKSCGGVCEIAPAPRLSHLAMLPAPVCRDCRYVPGGSAEECTICFLNEACVRLDPCGHASFCQCCAQKLFHYDARCPLCRQQIQNILQASPEA